MEAPERFDYIVVVGGPTYLNQNGSPSIYAFLRSAARAGVTASGAIAGVMGAYLVKFPG